MSVESVIQPNHLILCHPLFHLPSVYPESGSFPKSRLFPSGAQSIVAPASASVLPMNIQRWFPLGFTGLVCLQSKRLSRVFSNITVQKHQFSCIQPSPWANSHIRTWLLEKLSLSNSLAWAYWCDIWAGFQERVLGWELALHHFCQILLARAGHKHSPDLSSRKIDFTLSWWGKLESVTKGHEYRKESRIVWPCLQSATGLWGSRGEENNKGFISNF